MKKLFSIVSLLMVFALLLGACAPAAAPTAAPQEPAAPQATEPPAAAATEEPVATAAPGESVDNPITNAFGECDDPLTLMSGLTGSDGVIFSQLLEQFAADNPDVCISHEMYVWDTFFQKYPTVVAAGTPPDMVIFHQTEVTQMASQGLMLPLDDFFNDGTFSTDNFNTALIDGVSHEGKIMAVPFDNHGWLLWYNTELIEAAGLDPENLPANGEEFIEWAQKLTTDVNGLHPTDEGFDKDNVDVWAMEYTWPRYTIPSTLWQFGARVISEDGTTATLDSPEAIAAIQFWHDMMYKYYVAPPAIPGKMWAGDLYKNNRLVFMWEGTWTQGFMLDNPDVAAKTKTAFLNSLSPDGNQAVKFDAHIMSVPTGVDDDGIAKAKTLMAYLVQNGAFWSTSGQVPALVEVQSMEEVQSRPSVAMAAQQFNEIGGTDMSHKAFIEIQTAYEVAVGNALASATANVAEELQKGNEQIQAILDRP